MKKAIYVIYITLILITLNINNIYAEELQLDTLNNKEVVLKFVKKSRWIKGQKQYTIYEDVLFSSNNEKLVTTKTEKTVTTTVAKAASVAASLEANGYVVTTDISAEISGNTEDSVTIHCYREEQYVEISDWYKRYKTTYVEALYVDSDGNVQDVVEHGFVLSKNEVGMIKVITGTRLP